MRNSTLQEWSVILGVVIIALLLIPVLFSILSPKIPATTGTIWNLTSSDPVCSGADLGGFYQEALVDPQPVTKQVGDVTFILSPQYRYRIVGKVVGRDEYYLTPLDRLGPMDLTIANGDIIRPEILSQFTIQKYPRHFRYSYSFPPGTQPLSQQYATEHISNNHLIFANDTVHAKAKSAGVGDMVGVSGYLVSVRGTSPGSGVYTWETSTVRSDSGEHSCELVYVETFEKYPC